MSTAPDGMLERVMADGRRRRRRFLAAAGSGTTAVVVALALALSSGGGTVATLRPGPAAAGESSGGPSPHVSTAVADPVPAGTGRLILGVDADGRLVMARADGHVGEPFTPKAENGFIPVVATDPSGGWVAAVDEGASQRIVRIDLQGHLTPLPTDLQGGRPDSVATGVSSLAVSPDGRQVAIATLASGMAQPQLQTAPMPGSTSAPLSVVLTDRSYNEIKDLSWSPDGRTLAYIVGSQTGAGISGPAVFFDTAHGGSAVPTSSPWSTHGSDCFTDAVSYGGQEMFALGSCVRGTVPKESFAKVSAASGQSSSSVPFADTGCLNGGISVEPGSGDALITWCAETFLASPTGVRRLSLSLGDASWAGTLS